jgi:hypothetical protein
MSILRGQVLYLIDVELGAEGGAQLWPALTPLDGDGCLEALALRGNALGGGGLAGVAAFLASQPRLLSLDLAGNGLGDRGLDVLVAALAMPPPPPSDSGPLVGGSRPVNAKPASQATSLEELRLATNGIGEAAVLRLLRALADSRSPRAGAPPTCALLLGSLLGSLLGNLPGKLPGAVPQVGAPAAAARRVGEPVSGAGGGVRGAKRAGGPAPGPGANGPRAGRRTARESGAAPTRSRRHAEAVSDARAQTCLALGERKRLEAQRRGEGLSFSLSFFLSP